MPSLTEIRHALCVADCNVEIKEKNGKYGKRHMLDGFAPVTHVDYLTQVQTWIGRIDFRVCSAKGNVVGNACSFKEALDKVSVEIWKQIEGKNPTLDDIFQMIFGVSPVEFYLTGGDGCQTFNVNSFHDRLLTMLAPPQEGMSIGELCLFFWGEYATDIAQRMILGGDREMMTLDIPKVFDLECEEHGVVGQIHEGHALFAECLRREQAGEPPLLVKGAQDCSKCAAEQNKNYLASIFMIGDDFEQRRQKVGRRKMYEE